MLEYDKVSARASLRHDTGIPKLVPAGVPATLHKSSALGLKAWSESLILPLSGLPLIHLVAHSQQNIMEPIPLWRTSKVSSSEESFSFAFVPLLPYMRE